MSGTNGTAGTNAEVGTLILDEAYCLSNTDPNIDKSTFVNMPLHPISHFFLYTVLDFFPGFKDKG